jgi:hypothetical protein
MPAIAATYFAIMGVSCANTFSSRQELNNKQVKIWYKITNFTTVIIASTVILLSFYFSFVNIIRAGIDQEVSDMRAKKPFTAIKLQELIARQKSISSFYQSSNSLSNLAISEIFLANYYGYFSPQGRDMLESAKNNLQISLIKSPANSESWFRLAYIESLLESPSQSIANAIYMSIVSMPYDYKIIQSRLVLAEMVEDYFDDEQKEVIKNQITILKSHP